MKIGSNPTSTARAVNLAQVRVLEQRGFSPEIAERICVMDPPLARAIAEDPVGGKAITLYRGLRPWTPGADFDPRFHTKNGSKEICFTHELDFVLRRYASFGKSSGTVLEVEVPRFLVGRGGRGSLRGYPVLNPTEVRDLSCFVRRMGTTRLLNDFGDTEIGAWSPYRPPQDSLERSARSDFPTSGPFENQDGGWRANGLRTVGQPLDALTRALFSRRGIGEF